jgi:hypothetical protein
MPSSTAEVSGSVTTVGTDVGAHTEQGHVVVVVVSEIDAVVEDPFRVAVMTAVWAVEIVLAVAVNVAVVEDAGTATEAGVVSSGVLLDNVTGRQPVGAGVLNVTVQTLLAPDASEVGVQASEVTVTSGARLMEAVFELPFSAAVTTAVWALVTVPAVAVKEAVVAAAATVTLAGTVRLALLLVKATGEPPVGACALKVTVQALVPGPVKEAGLHARPLTVTGAISEIVELADEPLAVAVNVPVQVLVIVPAVAEKLAVVAPAAMLTEAGAVSNGLLDVSATVRPPVGAEPLKVTVHALLAPDVSEVGAQTSEVTVTRGARVMEAVFELPFNAAVMTAVWALVTVPAVAVKEAVVAAAATVTLAGTVRLALLLVKATGEPPVGAGPLKVTVQALVPGPVNEAGLQVRLLTVTDAISEIVELADEPLAVAVNVPVQVLVMVPAVAEKLAVVAPAAMLTEAGAVSNGLLDESATVRPPVGAGALAVTVQALLASDVNEVGVQTSEVTVTSGARVIEAVFELPFSAAVTTAVWALVTVPAVAVKEAVVAAAATVTLAGTVRLALLLVKATGEPPVGAGPLKVTVQALVPGPVKEAGLQVRPLTVAAGTVTTPPVAEVVIGMAVEEAEEAFVT